MKKVILIAAQLLFIAPVYAIEYDLPGVDEKNIPAPAAASVENYMQFIFLIIFLGVFLVAVWALATNARKYYNTQSNEDKDKAYAKMRDALIGLGVVVISVLGLWLLYPQYLTLSPTKISAIITALF